jgi:hypothetical protein
LLKHIINGQSLNSIARAFDTYPITVSRILVQQGVKLRHDTVSKGDCMVEDGEKLIEWAKTQGRLVSKAELAKVLGKTRLSNSYFLKYPELGSYVKGKEKSELQVYINQLRNWLLKHNITYRPNDKQTLGLVVTTLLLEPYHNIIIQLDIKPKRISQKKHDEMMLQKLNKAKEIGVNIIFLKKKHFKNLDCITELLHTAEKAGDK